MFCWFFLIAFRKKICKPELMMADSTSSPLFRPLKIREEADPYSLDVGVLEKGHLVKVLEVRYDPPNRAQ